MSIIGSIIGGSSPGGSGGQTPPPKSPSGSSQPSTSTGAEAQPSGGNGGNGGGSAATAETTQTNSQIPPVTASRSTNATTSSRPGSEGSAAVLAEKAPIDAAARLDAALNPELSEMRARRQAEAVQRQIIQKELLARIPVPIEAIPKLTGDVEQVRSIHSREEVEKTAA